MSIVNQENIRRVYAMATAGEIAAGLQWYQSAHDAADALHISPRVGAGVVAALSPGLRWERNIEAARRVINRESLAGIGVRYTANINKAYRIIAGEAPEIVLGGNKVRAFYRCILNPDNRHAVCVDGHAYGIWSGRRVALDKVPPLAVRGRYRRIAGDYIAVARSIGVLPHQLQAIVWCTWRRIHGVENNGNGRIAA